MFPEMQVEAYRNLHTGTLSVRRTSKGGKVFTRPLVAFIDKPRFVVQPKGREKVLATGQKNVHAFVRGIFRDPSTVPLDTLSSYYRPHRGDNDWRRARYNPSEAPFFEDVITGEPVTSANEAVVTTRGVFYR